MPKKNKPMGKGLKSNKIAMDIIHCMAQKGQTDSRIQKCLETVTGILWATCTIARQRRELGFKRSFPNVQKRTVMTYCLESPGPLPTASIAALPIPKPPEWLKHPSRVSTDNTFPKRPNTVAQFFQNSVGGPCIDVSNLSFAELGEYAVSFFEDLANHEKGERPSPPQSFWITARDKVMHWNRVRIRSNLVETNVAAFSDSQQLAYDYCSAMYEHTIKGSRNAAYFEVYALYRTWRDCFLGNKLRDSILRVDA